MSTSAAIQTGVRDLEGRQLATLPFAVRETLMLADELLRLYGMQFELICEACSQRSQNPNAWTVVAQHGADGSLSELVCRCTRRRFQAPF